LIAECVAFLLIRDVTKRMRRRNRTLHADRDAVLSAFYTRPEIAQSLVGRLFELLDPATEYVFVDPSAGDGAFFDCLPRDARIGVEVDTRLADQHEEYLFLPYETGGFLAATRSDLGLAHVPRSRVVVIGNPPWGGLFKTAGRCRTDAALRFIERASQLADTVAFLCSSGWKRFGHLHRIPQDMTLIHSEDVPTGSFTFKGRFCDVAGTFFVWRRMLNRCGQVVLRYDEPIPSLAKLRHDTEKYMVVVDPASTAANVVVLRWASTVCGIAPIRDAHDDRDTGIQGGAHVGCHQYSGKYNGKSLYRLGRVHVGDALTNPSEIEVIRARYLEKQRRTGNSNIANSHLWFHLDAEDPRFVQFVFSRMQERIRWYFGTCSSTRNPKMTLTEFLFFFLMGCNRVHTRKQ
jgi:hypothetical protein